MQDPGKWDDGACRAVKVMDASVALSSAHWAGRAQAAGYMQQPLLLY